MNPTSTRSALTTLRVVVLIVGAAIMITPFVYMLSTSFKPQAFVLANPPQFIPDSFTFDNYVQAWTKQQFARYAMNSVIVAVFSTALSVLISSMMAYSFARFEFPGRDWIFRILLIGLMVPAMMLITANRVPMTAPPRSPGARQALMISATPSTIQAMPIRITRIAMVEKGRMKQTIASTTIAAPNATCPARTTPSICRDRKPCTMRTTPRMRS